MYLAHLLLLFPSFSIYLSSTSVPTPNPNAPSRHEDMNFDKTDLYSCLVEDDYAQLEELSLSCHFPPQAIT